MLETPIRKLARAAIKVYRAFPHPSALTLSEVARRRALPRDGVLHLGANDGAEAGAYHEYGFSRVLWVEGYPRFYDALVDRLKAFPEQGALNVLISDVDREVLTFQVAANAVSSTACRVQEEYSENFPEVSFIKAEPLEARRLDEYFRENSVDLSGLRILVVDLEGSELKALRSLGRILEQFDYVLVEVCVANNFVSGPRLKDLDDFLLEAGFRRVEMRLTSSSGDAFYERAQATAFDRLRMRASELWQSRIFYSVYRDKVVRGAKRFARL